MSTPVTVTRGLASSSPTAARPEPAPTSTTRPDPDSKKPLRRQPLRSVDAESMDGHHTDEAPHGRNAGRNDQPSAPSQPESQSGKPAKERHRNQVSPENRPAVAEVIGKRSCHSRNDIDLALNRS